LLVRFGARRWIARIMLTWGLLAVGMMFVKSPIQFYIMRFLLGLAEAGFFPGVILYLTHWFPAAYRGRAISRFYVAWPLSTVVMGSVAGALLHLQGRLGLAGWQWLFLVEGLPAIAMSGVILVLLPDRPADAAWLTGAEKGWIERRLAADAALLVGAGEHGFLHALANPRVLQLGAVNFLILGAFYAFSLSAPAVLDGLTHLGVTKVGYLIAFSGLLGAAAMVFNGWHSDRSRERYFHLIVPLAAIAAAFAVVSLSTTPWVVMIAYLAAITFNAAVGAVFWLVPSDLLHPRATAVSVAAINAIGQSGSFFLPYAWGLSKDHTGSFHAALTALPFAFLVAAAIMVGMRYQARAGRRTAGLAGSAAS